MHKVTRNIRIDKEIWQKYRVLAFEKNTTVSAMIREHIDQDLQEAGHVEPEKELEVKEGGILE